MSINTPEIYVVLHNIRSTHNVGSIFRTADAVGVSKVYLCGITPAPIDRFGRKRNDISKTALGAEEWIEWESVKKTEDAISLLRGQGVEIAAVEQTKNSVQFDKFVPTRSIALVFGSETEGVPQAVTSLADVVIEIPMRGKKESLNVSVSAGIVLVHARQVSKG